MTQYSDVLMDHFTSPSNRRRLDIPDATGAVSLDGRPPFITVFLRVSAEGIEQATFEATGCGVTIAACSMLTEIITGKTVAQSLELTDELLSEALGGVPAHKRYCLSLAIRALRSAIDELTSE